MKHSPKRMKRPDLRRMATVVLLAALLAVTLLPVGVFAKKSPRVVRVGWYECPFNITDAYGRRSGYGYEYQQKIASETGWEYQYITDSWPNLLQMLKEGKIDLLSDVSFTEERANEMLFSALPMGAEEYYLYVALDNDTISADDLSVLNGKRVGFDKGSIQIGFFKEWEAANGIDAEIVELSDDFDNSLQKLRHGSIDAYVTLDGYLPADMAIPVCKIGASDFYFAVSSAQPELLDELNNALSRIQSENPYYNQQLNAKYIQVMGVNRYLSAVEKTWLADHGAIRVGYQDNYLAFCAKDPLTGGLTGALRDYLEVAENCLENAKFDFEAVCYPTASAAMEALKNGEVDCMFPANLTDYDGEKQGYFMTSPLMRTDISAVIREEEKRSFFEKDHISVAVNAGNPNYDMFLVDNFPSWRSVIFEDTPTCLAAIADGKADCLLLSNYRFNNVAALCRKYGLIQVSTGVEMDYSFAVRRDSIELLSILNKIADCVPDSTINSALSYHFTEDAKLTFADTLAQNAGIVITAVVAFLALILSLLFYNIRAKRKLLADKKLLAATETDKLTTLYNKSFFYEYASRLYLEDLEKPMDAIAFNVEQFHSVNAIYSWEFGDKILAALGRATSDFILEHGGVAGHLEADRFLIYCPHLEHYDELFERLQNAINALAPDAGIWIRMGVMPFERGVTPRQLIEQAMTACSLARGRYKERIIIFDGQVRERENFEQRLKNDVKHAAAAHQFVVCYQPEFDIRSDEPVLRGAEALVRWNHPEYGLLQPDSFIPLFEQDGLISIVDRCVWEEVTAQIARWKKEYGVVVPVSVNLSRVDVSDPHLADRLDALLQKHGPDHSAIKLEITESAYIENAEDVLGSIDSLRARGYEIAMDDFGTGYSSLNLLSTLPINLLKMDRAFIKNTGRGTKDDRMVEVILEIAKIMQLPVVAEGVETDEQLAFLKKLGCDMVQGYCLSRPISVEDFEEKYLRNKAD